MVWCDHSWLKRASPTIQKILLLLSPSRIRGLVALLIRAKRVHKKLETVRCCGYYCGNEFRPEYSGMNFRPHTILKTFLRTADSGKPFNLVNSPGNAI